MYLLKQQNRLSPNEEAGLRAQFSHFIENIRAARENAEALKTQVEDIKSAKGEKDAFCFLARSMGYEF